MCADGQFEAATKILMALYTDGFATSDLLGTIFRSVNYDDLPEALRLQFMRLIAETHLRMAEGSTSVLQLTGMLGSMCLASGKMGG